MFSTAIKGGKAFTAEQKLKELKKKRIFRLKSLEKRKDIQTEVFRKKKLSKTKTARDISKSF